MNEKQDLTRTRLLEATLTLLGDRGLARTTSREIAAEAGVNLQAITYHFGSKDRLVAQALVHAVRSWTEPARTALVGIADDPVGGLLSAVLAVQDAFELAREQVPGYLEALAAASHDPALRDEIAGVLGELRRALATSIRELRDAGYIAAWVQPEPMAALIVAAGDGLVLHSVLDPAEDHERILQQVVQLLLAARTSD